MLAKLLSFLATAKGATAAVVIVTAAAGSTVVATNPDVQRAVQQTIAQSSPKTECATKSSESGKPEVVSLRNAADALLRDTFQKDQRAIEDLRSPRVEGADRQRLEDALKAADTKLHARYQKALDEVGALTLGREGHEDASASADADSSPKAKTTDCAKADATATSNAKLGVDGVRKLDAVVTTAKSEMDAIVKDAQKAIPTPAPSPSPSHGRPSEPPASVRP